MLSLVLKDLLLVKKYLIWGALYVFFLILAFQKIPSSQVLVAATVALAHVLVQNVCAIDEKNKADLFLNSLPLSRKEIVGARFVSIFFFALLALLYSLVIFGLIVFLKLPFKTGPIEATGIVVAFGSVALINSVFLPVYFRQGYIAAKWVNFVLFLFFFGMGVSAEVVLPKLIGFASVFSNPLMAFVIFAALLTTVSYGLSVSFYQGRDF